MMWQFDAFGNDTAIFQENGSSLTYAELSYAARDLGEMVSKRCLAFILCTNEIGSLLGYVTFLNNRIVPFMADAGLDRGLLDSLMDTYRPNFLWCPKRMAADFPGCIIVYDAFGYSLLRTGNDCTFPLYDDLALLLTTSGSTGSPKLVRQSYANIRANTESIIEYLKIDKTERTITTLPMSYTYGLSIINTHLYVGASIILTESTLLQRDFWQRFKEYGATSFGGVPYTYEILDKIKFYKMDLPSLRTMTQAGGKLTPELHKKIAEYAMEKKINFVVMYGQTEATARMSFLPPARTLEKYGSMGIAIPGGLFLLVDPEGNEISEADVVGELLYKGANVTLGYSQCGEDLSKGDEWGGVLLTGDMAKRDEEGYFYIVGRKKRFLKIYGSRINLDEIERMLRTAFQDSDFACGGGDDDMYIFLTDGGRQVEVRKFLSEKTSLNQLAFHIVVIEQIPRSESGKIQYSELSKYYKS